MKNAYHSQRHKHDGSKNKQKLKSDPRMRPNNVWRTESEHIPDRSDLCDRVREAKRKVKKHTANSHHLKSI